MLFIFVPFLLLVTQAWSQTVVTSKGTIVGQKAIDGDYYTYFGIPYAHVNENKPFENTQEPNNFSSPFNASDPFIRCPQVTITEGGILQCLRLNIYVPAGGSDLPVFVWFHGGGLAFGSGGEYNATHLVREGVIAVTANYRLGPYGFLCTSDIKNQGLKDMKTALKWIRKNIKAFGGNPDKVTIAGESWGGSAVDFLLYEDADFNQAIVQSGPRFSYAVSSRENTEVLIVLAARLGFQTNKYKDALKFLNTANPIEVMRAYNDMEYSYVFGICEKPGDFKLKFNKKYAKKIRNTPIMIGVTSKETFEDIASKPDSYYATVENDFYESLGKVFDLKNETLRNLANIVWKFYLGEKPISKDAMLEIVDLSSDFQENYGTERSVTNYLKLQNPKVYKYVYSYIGEESRYKNVTGVGAYHTQELPYLFNWGIELTTEEQFKMRRWLVKLWTNFVKYGNPTPSNEEVIWLPTNLSTRPYLDINLKSEMRNHVYHERMAFWELLWTAYGKCRK